MAQKKESKALTSSQKVGLGVGLTAAAAAAAGAFFLYGAKNSEKNRKKVKSWMLKAKGEVLEALEKGGQITEDEYRSLVKAATGAYASVQKASTGEMKEFKNEMEDHWKKLQRTGALKKVVAVVTPKAPAKKAAPKKAVAKAPAKAPAKKAAPKKAAAKKAA